jgi:hypothetical protein
MAREESSREDLLREATALVERFELVPHSDDLGCSRVVAGFRRDGALSLFFDEDPVYQFNAVGELRRAYCDGWLLKAVGGRLVAMQRVRTQDQVQLVSHELSEAEKASMLAQMAEYLRKLAVLLDDKSFEIAGQVPSDAEVPDRLRNWLATHPRWSVARRPNV